MKYYGPIAAFTRREFLLASAALPGLTCLSSAAAPPPAAQKQTPSYLELVKFIPPGSDDFHGEKEAAQIEEHLKNAFASKQLPVHAERDGTRSRRIDAYRAFRRIRRETYRQSKSDSNRLSRRNR